MRAVPFALRLGWRVATVMASAVVTAALFAWFRAPTAALLAALTTVVAATRVWALVDQGNRDLARFVTALEHGDLGQAFGPARRDARFGELGDAYDRAMTRLRAERTAASTASRFAEATVDGAPVALLTVEADGRTHFANKAARRLFGRDAPCPVHELDRYGAPFARAVAEGAPGPTRLTHLALGGLPQRVAIDVTLVEAAGFPARRVVAVKVIQAELDGAELAAQVDLVRVLTHEIMNSLTPVTSLAQTAAAAVAAHRGPELEDARLATAALARRAGELERFVASYRRFSEAPVIEPAPVDLDELLADAVRLFRSTPGGQNATVTVTSPPAPVIADADAGLLTQVFLNLLKNAGEAAGDPPAIGVELAAAGDGLQLLVTDDGPGIPASHLQEVFLPFFTTKRQGTGIGLSFARQVILLHGGRIAAEEGPGGRVRVLLPRSRGAGTGR